jgi:hypothetical protein
MPMSRQNLAALIAGGLVLAFLIGFLPTWSRARSLDRELSATRHELALARLQGRIGAALVQVMQQEYESSRQMMAGYFTDLQGYRPAIVEPERRAAADEILAQRDEVITLLSRSDPQGIQRLARLHARWSAAVDPGTHPPAVQDPVTPDPDPQLDPPAPSN